MPGLQFLHSLKSSVLPRIAWQLLTYEAHATWSCSTRINIIIIIQQHLRVSPTETRTEEVQKVYRQVNRQSRREEVTEEAAAEAIIFRTQRFPILFSSLYLHEDDSRIGDRLALLP